LEKFKRGGRKREKGTFMFGREGGLSHHHSPVFFSGQKKKSEERRKKAYGRRTT